MKKKNIKKKTVYKPGDLVRNIWVMERPLVKGSGDYSLTIPEKSVGMVIRKTPAGSFFSVIEGSEFYDCLFTTTTGTSIVTDVNERNLELYDEKEKKD